MKHDKTPGPSRIVTDSFGELEIPVEALYSAHTQRAVQNFPISGITLPPVFIHAIAWIKGAAAKANADLKLLPGDTARAIIDAADSVAEGHYDKEFPIDVFQTGSATSTNMNVNEVIAQLASIRSNLSIHPNDQVNMCQSSNDVIPTAIHLSTSLQIKNVLLPSLHHLQSIIEKKAKELESIVKTGRTHLMDAMPLTFKQEMSAWAKQLQHGIQRIEATFPRLHALAIGGTAIGTGINAPPDFGMRVCNLLTEKVGVSFSPQSNYFEGIACQDTSVELSGALKVLAVSLTKISNDLRWMNSGPIAGLAEIALPAIQPGSSIMPGKVNPVIPEAVCMACAQVFGNDVTVTFAGQSGNFQLNTMLPLIAFNLLQSIQLMANSARLLADRAIAGFSVNAELIQKKLWANPILVTALNPIIGYEKGAEIAKRAYREQRSILEVAKEMTELSEEELLKLLDPKSLTEGGISGISG